MNEKYTAKSIGSTAQTVRLWLQFIEKIFYESIFTYPFRGMNLEFGEVRRQASFRTKSRIKKILDNVYETLCNIDEYEKKSSPSLVELLPVQATVTWKVFGQKLKDKCVSPSLHL